jgi:hypothetical protein
MRREMHEQTTADITTFIVWVFFFLSFWQKKVMILMQASLSSGFQNQRWRMRETSVLPLRMRSFEPANVDGFSWQLGVRLPCILLGVDDRVTTGNLPRRPRLSGLTFGTGKLLRSPTKGTPVRLNGRSSFAPFLLESFFST